MQFGEDGNVKRFSVETIGVGQRPANYFHNNPSLHRLEAIRRLRPSECIHSAGLYTYKFDECPPRRPGGSGRPCESIVSCHKTWTTRAARGKIDVWFFIFHKTSGNTKALLGCSTYHQIGAMVIL
jgi:hypothetical protein